MHDDLDPLAEAFLRCAEYGGGTPFTVQIDLDNSTVVPGDRGLYDGLVIASWSR